jgi:hypothetical protein
MTPQTLSAFPQIDPEAIKKELRRQLDQIYLRLKYVEALRTGVSQQGVAKQKLLEWEINGLSFTRMDDVEHVERKTLLFQKRDGVGRECKARCELLTLDIEDLHLHRQRLVEQLEQMEQRVLIPTAKM